MLLTAGWDGLGGGLLLLELLLEPPVDLYGGMVNPHLRSTHDLLAYHIHSSQKARSSGANLHCAVAPMACKKSQDWVALPTSTRSFDKDNTARTYLPWPAGLALGQECQITELELCESVAGSSSPVAAITAAWTMLPACFS